MDGFLLQTTIYLIAMVIAVPISVRLGLGSVLGYLIAGIMIGPVLGLVGAETEDLQHYAEFGVVLMLFLIGLELDPRAALGHAAPACGTGRIAGRAVDPGHCRRGPGAWPGLARGSWPPA